MNLAVIGIALGAIGAVVLLAISFGGSTGSWLKSIGQTYQAQIERADLSIKPEDFALIVFGVALALWLIIMLVLRVNLVVGFFVLPICFAFCLLAGNFFLKFRGDRRIGSFVNQLEMILRMMAGALRVGLGLRQSMILVAEEMPDPARREFQRIIGRTNIGIGINDALDEMAKSLPAAEVIMMSRAIRVQSQTGGDLASVLETLASTIKDRRRIYRKMSALTAQGKAGAWIIGALPLLVGSFVVFTQPDLGGPLLHTFPGWVALGIVAVLELLSALTLAKILSFDV
ncbi:MAG TPA: type II secretion system F family protein [Candidatus Baltobacteraceae bacterium]